MSGAKIIEGLKAAIDGDISRVTIEGQTWLRATELASDLQEIMRINNTLRSLLNEAMNSRAPDYVNVAHPRWSERVRAAVTQ